jgi:hypothetical protein
MLDFRFVDKKHACLYLNLSSATLKKYRKQGDWIEGIHWVRLNTRCIRYNLGLLQDWLHNRENPIAHVRAIENYQASLLSEQPRRKSR